ncbi:Ubiquinone/menaquinone biosynthesis methyltransferase ubiE [Verticillium dahliae VDG1]|nr:Ubiquinone/menaquinone biosynthesis methyltransferase ubiE [Verticillium dahliae VDG1]
MYRTGIISTAQEHWFLLAASLLPLFLCYSICLALVSPLRSIPGPFVARFTNLCASALKAIYGPAAASLFPKSPSYRPAAPPDPSKWTLFADEDIQRHAAHRRLFQSAYSMSSLVTYEAYVDECADLFALRLTELGEAAESSSEEHLSPPDMGHWFQCFAFDVIGLITYSRRFGFLDRGDDVGGLIRTIDKEMVYFTLTGVFHSLHKLLFPIRNRMAGSQGTGRTYLMNFTKECIAEHQSRPAAASTEQAEAARAPMDFLSKFFQKHAGDPARFTMYHVLAGCASNIVAGSDTTATSLSGILYHLLKAPGTFARLRAEADQVSGQARHISWAQTQKMTYLQAVIKEALRLHTAVALPMERVVPTGGVEIEGHFFPEGTLVGINPWVYHRHTAIFGPDADAFNPDRWLTTDAGRLSIMNKNLISFGAGARTCIGRHIAHLQMAKLIPRIVRDFDFSDINSPSKERWSTTNYFFLKPSNFKVRVKSRTPRAD